MPDSARRAPLAFDRHQEGGPLQLERRQFGRDRLLQPPGGRPAPLRQRRGCSIVAARRRRARPAPAPPDAPRRIPAPQDRPAMRSANAGRSPTVTECLRAAARSANRRSSVSLQLARIEVRGGKRAGKRPAPPPPARSAPGRAPPTAPSSSPPASGALRSSRRTRLARIGTGEAEPATVSCASAISPAIFSARIIRWRRSASASSSSGSGASAVSSSTAARR